MKQRKPPVGQFDFKTIIERNFYYLDKSLFIREVWENPYQALLIPRPRRFGKTVNLSMLRYFFEKTSEDHSALFQNLKIQEYPETMIHQGQYPVIFLTLKNIKEPTFDRFLQMIRQEVAQEYKRHLYLLDQNELEKQEKKEFLQICEGKSDIIKLELSLYTLSNYLYRSYGKKVIVLIDEYDTPIHEGYHSDYYDEIIGFNRNFFGSVFKDNLNLEKGVLTGILRIAKESIFSELNNLGNYSFLQSEFSQSFGFTLRETEQILKDFDLSHFLPDVCVWYDGYLFGKEVIFNPWSILSFLVNEDHFLSPYWINTSTNLLIKELILQEKEEIREELEKLLQGGSLIQEVEENIILREIQNTPNGIWSLLLFSGYLKPLQRIETDNGAKYKLEIPNKEVRYFFRNTIKNWLHQKIKPKLLNELLESLISGEIKIFEKILQKMVLEILSYHDPVGEDPEQIYHAFVLGLLIHLGDQYQIRSNRESGLGRYDIMLLPSDPAGQPGIILEFKKSKKGETPQNTLKKALDQIQDKKYATELQTHKVRKIFGVAVVFKGKKVYAKKVKIKS